VIAANAYAKVNIGLRIGALREDGFHRVGGIFQSVDLADRLAIDVGETDEIQTSSGGSVPDGLDNLAFRAVAAVRSLANSAKPIQITLDKTIPTAAGLGGGSADAAAALAMAGRFFGVEMDVLESLAPSLGSDVPFCLRGGSARVSGRGDVIEPISALDGFSLAIVVPPIEVSTPAGFGKWDEMVDPRGLRIGASDLPPALRPEESIVNDLYPAAVALASEIDDWRRDLEKAWGRAVMMSGSGPSLYGFFIDREEATDALAAIPRGTRSAEACDLISRGWRLTGQHDS
jgi:4-diphosphocytidyl-2-C-methyl-D-erythritol kinase